VATTYKGGMTGNFTLTVTDMGTGTPPNPGGPATPLVFQKGQLTKVQGNLANTDPADAQGKYFKAFTFQAQAGKTYLFEMSGQGGLDPFLRLEDANGKHLKNEDFGDGKVSRISFTAPLGGSYKIIATAFKGGMTGS